MKNHRVSVWIQTGIFAALICAATMLVQIPLPATGGYANPGDGIILTCAFLLSPLSAIIAAGVGSALADLLLGYVVYAPATLLIKGLMALVAHTLLRQTAKGGSPAAFILPALAAECMMVLGYFIYESLILFLGVGALGSVPGNIGQGIAGVLIACAITPVLKKVKIFN